MVKKTQNVLDNLNAISKKLHALKTLGIRDHLLQEKYEEAYSKHLQGETDDARLLCEELTFLFTLIEDFISRQINNIKNYEQKADPSWKSDAHTLSEALQHEPHETPGDLQSIFDNVLSHPFFRDQALKHLEHLLIEEINNHLPVLQDSLITLVQNYLAEEKISIKSQLYNTLRYDLLQYLEHKGMTSRK